jgi:hypothetical protein
MCSAPSDPDGRINYVVEGNAAAIAAEVRAL